MRINSIPPKNLYSQYIHVRPIKSASVASSGTDRTDLTEGAKMFSSALKEALETMETRSPEQLARIDEVAEQIKNNTYNVPGSEVAKKILGV